MLSFNKAFAVVPILSTLSGDLEFQIIVNDSRALELMMSFVCSDVRWWSTAVSIFFLIVTTAMSISSIVLVAIKVIICFELFLFIPEFVTHLFNVEMY